MKLLLVDDSLDVLKMLGQTIRVIDNVEIVGQTRGEEDAMRLCCSQRPDIVFMDLSLKQGNGISLLKRIKKENPAAIVFIFTSVMYSQYERRCRELGATYLFDKLMEIPRAIRTLKELVNQSQKEEGNRTNGKHSITCR